MKVIPKKRLATRLNVDGGIFSMPGGFKVRVEILDKDEAEEEIGPEYLAHYCHDDHLIQLRRSRSNADRLTDLEHELQHCCVDWVDFFIRKAKK